MADVTFTANHQPAPACYPSDVNGMLDLLATGALSGSILDTAGGGVFVGSAPPPSSLTNKVWFRTDAAGRPTGVLMFYNGNWRKVYTAAGLGEVRIYAGNPSGLFDGTGRGTIGGDWDGWALCIGTNGTPDLRNRFIVAAEGWNGAWLSSMENPGVTEVQVGGQSGPHMINSRQLPPLLAATHGAADAAGGTQRISLGQTTLPLAVYYPVVDGNTGQPVDGVNQQPTPYPPYYVLAYVMFVGYQ
jgi:hypothetical protein